MAHGPGRLQVEAARDGIHVQYLAGEIEAGMVAALQRRGVDVAQADAAAGDKLLLIGRTSRYGEGTGRQTGREGVEPARPHL